MAVTSFKRSLYSSNPDKYVSFLAGNPFYVPPSFESIATATGTGSSGTITFSSIPSTYKHLQIRIHGKDTEALYSRVGLIVRANGDTTSNYAYHAIRGDGSTAAASGSSSATSIQTADGMAGGSEANVYGAAIIDIHDYASTAKNKTFRIFIGVDNNGSGHLRLNSGLWMSTSAITSISLLTNNQFWTTGSVFSLYGIK